MEDSKSNKGYKGCKGCGDEMKGLQKELEECEKQKQEYLAGWQRQRADFLNYKKEEMEKMAEITRYAEISFIFQIIAVLDNFYLAERHIPEKSKKRKDIKGLLQIKKQMEDMIKKHGVEKIECLGCQFNPELHEAVEMVESSKDKKEKSGTIIEESQRGYTAGGKVLRPAKVKVIK